MFGFLLNLETKHKLLGQGKIVLPYKLISLSTVVKYDSFLILIFPEEEACEAGVHRAHRNLNAHKFSRSMFIPGSQKSLWTSLLWMIFACSCLHEWQGRIREIINTPLEWNQPYKYTECDSSHTCDLWDIVHAQDSVYSGDPQRPKTLTLKIFPSLLPPFFQRF